MRTSKVWKFPDFQTSQAGIKSQNSEQGQLLIPFEDWMDVTIRLKDSDLPVHISGPVATVLNSLDTYVRPYASPEKFVVNHCSDPKKLVKG